MKLIKSFCDLQTDSTLTHPSYPSQEGNRHNGANEAYLNKNLIIKN